jgi:hypothetical protein
MIFPQIKDTRFTIKTEPKNIIVFLHPDLQCYGITILGLNELQTEQINNMTNRNRDVEKSDFWASSRCYVVVVLSCSAPMTGYDKSNRPVTDTA